MWNSKFIGGAVRLDPNRTNGCQVAVFSTSDSDVERIYNGGDEAIDAYWQGGKVIVVLRSGAMYAWDSPNSNLFIGVAR